MSAKPQNSLASKPLYIEVRRLPERPQDVPASVLVISNEQIDAQKIASPTDIADSVPGFSFNDPFGRFNPAPSMRGLIQPGLGDDPSVGFFTDGLYVSGRSSINSLAFDLAQIDVAKGPQNALFGRNSFGGTINAVSNAPEKTTYGWLEAVSGTKDRNEITAGINMNFSEQVQSRLAVYWRDWGGYFKNALASGPDIGREKTSAIKLSTAFTPNDRREFNLRLAYAEDDDSQPKGFLVETNCGPRTTDGVLRLYCGELPERGSPYSANDVGTEQSMGYHREHTRGSLEWTEFLSPRTSLTTLIGGAYEDSVFIRDDDYQAVNSARAGVDTRRHDVQVDTRLHTKTASGQWSGLWGVSGYHFLNTANRIDQFYVLGQTTSGGARVHNGTDTLGTYGSITYRAVPQLALTLDGRWQVEKKFLASSTIAASTGRSIDLEDSWRGFTPKFTASWQNPSGLLYYGSVAKGYKTGGFNDRANIRETERVYQPEQNITYEVGIKNIKPTTRVSLDMGLFWIDWQDQQVLAYSTAGTTQNFFLNNAGQTTSKGLEASLSWDVTDQLNVTAGYTYADARYDQYNDPDLANVTGFAPNGNVSGKRLPRYSPHQAVLSGSYRTPSPLPRTDFVMGSQLKFDSSQFTDNSNTAKTGARTMVNLQAGLDHPGGYAGVWVNNLLDERDPSVGIPWTDAAQGFRREWLVVPEDGLTAGLRIKVKF